MRRTAYNNKHVNEEKHTITVFTLLEMEVAKHKMVNFSIDFRGFFNDVFDNVYVSC